MSGATAAAAPMPGAFDLRGRGASPAQTGIAAAASAALATASSAKSNDWTIVGLVLPVPDDIRRFPREAINGAVTHAAHLLHILSVYLGIQLPFAVTSALGTSTIRPHPLWSITSGWVCGLRRVQRAILTPLQTQSLLASLEFGVRRACSACSWDKRRRRRGCAGRLDALNTRVIRAAAGRHALLLGSGICALSQCR